MTELSPLQRDRRIDELKAKIAERERQLNIDHIAKELGKTPADIAVLAEWSRARRAEEAPGKPVPDSRRRQLLNSTPLGASVLARQDAAARARGGR